MNYFLIVPALCPRLWWLVCLLWTMIWVEGWVCSLCHWDSPGDSCLHGIFCGCINYAQISPVLSSEVHLGGERVASKLSFCELHFFECWVTINESDGTVLNFALMLLLPTLGMVRMYVLRPDAWTVMLGLKFCNPCAKLIVAVWFPVVDPSGVHSCDADRQLARAAVLDTV